MKTVDVIGSFAACLVLSSAQVLKPLNTAVQYSNIEITALDISQYYNNRAFGLFPGDADFDGSQNSYPAQYHPGSNLSYGGFKYNFPEYRTKGNDNVVVQGQNISVKQERYFSMQILAAAETGTVAGEVIAQYADGSTSLGQILVSAWWVWAFPSGGDIVMPFYYLNDSANFNKSNIFQTVSWLDSSKELVSLTLPTSNDNNRLHIFAISLWPLTDTSSRLPQLEVQYARSTQKWVEDTDKTQIYEVLVSNVGQYGWVHANDSVIVSIESEGVETVVPGIIKRLRPGDQVTVEIGVVNKDGIASGTKGKAWVHLKSHGVNVKHDFEAVFGITPFDATYKSIYGHESPGWYNGAKYGIFIHWGIYSVPAWGNRGGNETYAEWYWWNLNTGPGHSDQTYEFHLQNYGQSVIYDDFIANFTAEAFDAKDWVDLFADAGAQYFVPVTKHHDGYAIFDLPANVTKRTSVALFPHRNLLQELFDAAAMYQPHLHRGTYYSLPEWFHPDYKKYGFGRWPGGNATNPFTNVTEPYTGYVPVDDFIKDLILPEMNTLAAMGSEIMWCDIGGPNMTAEFAANWFNQVAAENRQVVMNSRCGLPGDFDTPEYATYDAIQPRKWESNLGMDPYSYGFNRATAVSDYMNASTIVTSLVDIVSKNGNLLLDIGPMANGSIIDVEVQNLKEAGAWIKSHAEAIFNTTYWFVTPGEGDIRFTKTIDTFYILVMNQINDTLTLTSPIPWVEGDVVTVVGGGMNGTIIPTSSSASADQTVYTFEISKEIQMADQWVWVFKFGYI